MPPRPARTIVITHAAAEVRAELTGNWGESMVQLRVGYRRIEPIAWYVVLTPERHLESVSFDVVYEPWHWRP